MCSPIRLTRPGARTSSLGGQSGKAFLNRATRSGMLTPAEISPTIGAHSVCGLSTVRLQNGLGSLSNVAGPGQVGFSAQPYADFYEQLIKEHGSELAVVAIGPLTNLAGLLHERPGLLA